MAFVAWHIYPPPLQLQFFPPQCLTEAFCGQYGGGKKKGNTVKLPSPSWSRFGGRTTLERRESVQVDRFCEPKDRVDACSHKFVFVTYFFP